MTTLSPREQSSWGQWVLVAAVKKGIPRVPGPAETPPTPPPQVSFQGPRFIDPKELDLIVPPAGLTCQIPAPTLKPLKRRPTYLPTYRIITFEA